MHIVLLNDDSLPGARGGAAVVVDMLQRELERHGHTVTFITTHRSGPLMHREHFISLPVDYPLRERHFRCLKNSAVSQTLDTVLKKLKPDLVHAHNIHTYLTYDALNIARKYTDHIFLTAHDTFLVSFGRVKTPHRMHFWEHLATCGRQYNPWRNSVIRCVLQKTNAKVIAISNVLKHFLEMNDIPVSDIVYNGTELPYRPSSLRHGEEPRTLARMDSTELTMTCKGAGRLEPRKELDPLSNSSLTILIGGRVSDDKGMEVFWKAAALVQKEIPDVRFCVVGDRERIQPYLSHLPQTIRERTEAPGWLPREAMSVAYESCTVVTTPSIYLDPFNLMNIEAMAHGKPVVGTSFGGTPEIVEDNVTGFVRDPRDTNSYADALITLLKNRTLAERMGEAGRQRILEKFSAERMVEGYLKKYKQH